MLDPASRSSDLAEPPVDELVARAEMRRQASDRLPALVAGTTGVAMDEHRLVQATTTASGELRDLQLHPAALSVGGRKLAEMIMQAAALATEYAKQRCFNALAQVLGDIATAELEAMIGPAPARAAGWDTVSARDGVPAPARAPEPVQEAETPATGVPALAELDPDDPLSFDPSSLRSDR
jgi:hypothetical protein